MRRHARAFTVTSAVLAMCAVGSQLSGQGADAATKQTIEQLDREWGEAFVKGDAATLNRIIAPDWIGVNQDGTANTRENTIADMTSRRIVLTSIDFIKVNVRVFGDTAIAVAEWTETGIYAGKEYTSKIVGTDVYLKRDNAWQAVASQETKAP
jgi:ketosteroid isomerase-like protein